MGVLLQVVQWLLANNYLMTALELLVEAQEVGREDEVEELNVFFADRDKFPPEELVKYDQNDGAHLLGTTEIPMGLCTHRTTDVVRCTVMLSTQQWNCCWAPVCLV